MVPRVLSIHHSKEIKISVRLRFDFRKMLDDFEARTGVRPSYAELSEQTKISSDTLKSLATRESYNTTLHTLEKLGKALAVNPIKYLEWDE